MELQHHFAWDTYMTVLKKWYFGIAVCSVAFLLETFLPITLF